MSNIFNNILNNGLDVAHDINKTVNKFKYTFFDIIKAYANGYDNLFDMTLVSISIFFGIFALSFVLCFIFLPKKDNTGKTYTKKEKLTSSGIISIFPPVFISIFNNLKRRDVMFEKFGLDGILFYEFLVFIIGIIGIFSALFFHKELTFIGVIIIIGICLLFLFIFFVFIFDIDINNKEIEILKKLRPLLTSCDIKNSMNCNLPNSDVLNVINASIPDMFLNMVNTKGWNEILNIFIGSENFETASIFLGKNN